jgi:signal transduction histidine kinase
MPRGNLILILPPETDADYLRAQLQAVGYAVQEVFDRPTRAVEYCDSTQRAETCPDLALVDWALAQPLAERNALRLLSLWHDFSLVFLVDKSRLPPPENVLNGEPFFLLVQPFEIVQAQAVLDMAMYQRRLEADLRANQIELENLNRELENRVKRMLRTRHLEVLGRMTGGIIHDFNSLLLVIRNQCEALGAAHPELQSELAVINQARQNAGRLIDRLRAFSQKQTLQPAPLDPAELVMGMGSILRSLVGVRIQLRIDTFPNGRPILADPVQLQQAVMNLVGNARDAVGDAGHITVRVFEKTAAAPERVNDRRLDPRQLCVIEVADDGCGMDEETQQHLFEPFYTTKGDKGTGLGLSTVYGFVKQSGGFIEVESRPGKGAKFRINLPVMKESEA